MTTTHAADIARLLAALDAGDDDVLPILADALEEDGDPRAAGLRREMPAPEKYPWGGAYWSLGWDTQGRPGEGVITFDVFNRLPGGRREGGVGYVRAVYPTRSAAYLALALAPQ